MRRQRLRCKAPRWTEPQASPETTGVLARFSSPFPQAAGLLANPARPIRIARPP